MWDREKYCKTITEIVRAGRFIGEPVKSKEDVYKLIGSEMGATRETVIGWTRATSHGPGGGVEALKQLEALLNVRLTKSVEADVTEEVVMAGTYSNFVKENIKKAYELIADYLMSEEVEDENAYCEMLAEVEKLEIAIPKEIYVKIKNFIDMYVDQIIYDTDEFFADMHTEEFGYWDDEHCFHLKNEDATLKFCCMFMEKLLDIRNKLQEFAMKELYPILVS